MSNLLSKTNNKKAKRVGRGGKRGKTAGRGTKGQKARAGHRIRPHIRDEIKRLPKLRGRGKNSNKAFREKATAVNLSVLDALFASGARVTAGLILGKGVAARTGGTLPKIKVLAGGDITKPLALKGLLVSEAAKKKIIAAGGTVN